MATLFSRSFLVEFNSILLSFVGQKVNRDCFRDLVKVMNYSVTMSDYHCILIQFRN